MKELMHSRLAVENMLPPRQLSSRALGSLDQADRISHTEEAPGNALITIVGQ
ncbi:MAG: hypothetical protein JSS99_16340 [Actinobacteria bacterium]|nr:hypothetical protein [Actinomycetota bacterium]